MKRTVLVGLVTLVFFLGLIVGAAIRPRSVAAATGAVQWWGLIENPDPSGPKVLALYDPSTGEIWGYPDLRGLDYPPIRIGKLTKVGEPIAKNDGGYLNLLRYLFIRRVGNGLIELSPSILGPVRRGRVFGTTQTGPKRTDFRGTISV